MSLSRYLCVSALVFALLPACASRAPSRPTEVPPPRVEPSAEGGGDAHATCVAVFERQRACTADFIPALVALRVRLDVPAGIAEEDQKGGRDALVAQAMEEWKSDSTDAAIAATCDRLAGGDPEGIHRARECLDASTCAAFTECILPVVEAHLRR